jgi:hypothetical protein
MDFGIFAALAGIGLTYLLVHASLIVLGEERARAEGSDQTPSEARAGASGGVIG